MIKKLLFVFAILAMFAITGCGSKPVNNSVAKVESNSKTVKATISETVILDQNGVKVTAKSLSYGSTLGPEIKLLIENDSDRDITIQSRYFSVNGLMIDSIFSEDVATGKKANSEITIMDSDLKVAGITAIKDIEFDLVVMDMNSFDDLFEVKGIKLTTSATDYVQSYNSGGALAIDQDGVKIYVLKKDDKTSFWGADIYVYIENNTGKNITVQTRDVSVDGFMVDPTFSSDVAAGKKAYDTITFYEDDLKNNGITDIKSIELKFDVFDADSWDDIFVSDVKKITFSE